MNKYRIAEYLINRIPSYSKSKYSIENLNIYLEDKYFLNAVELATPIFYGIIKNKLDSGQPLSKKENLTLKKYINRIHFRSTPFGLFSYLGLSAWQEPAQHHSAQDKEELQAFYQHDINEEKKEMRYFTNESIYKVDKEVRYIKQQPDKNGALEWKIYSVRSSNLIGKIIYYCMEGKTISDIILHIIGHEDVSNDEAASFIDELLETQLLYPETLQGPVKNKLLTKNASIVINKQNVTDNLIQGENTISSLGHINLFNDQISYLNNKYISSIREAIDSLTVLSPQSESSRFNSYKEKFNQKYDRKPVQLLQALDPEIGIAYIEGTIPDSLNSVIKDVNFEKDNSSVTSIDWSKSHRLLLRKVQQAGQSKSIEITDKDLDEIRPKKNQKSFSTSFSVMFKINYEGKIIIENVGGASALSLLGRFTEYPKIDTFVKDIAQTEISMNEEVIFAEINSLVSNKHLNINLRNNPYPYEICIGVPCIHDNQIPLNDLYVFHARHQLIIYSKTLKKRIIPRLSSAYNYDIDSLPVFQFLCDLQYQHIHYNLNIRLEDFFPGLSFYPKITYKETILHLAIWYLDAELLLTLKNTGFTDSIILFEEYCVLNHIPERIALIEHDKFLVFNLGNIVEKEFFMECIKGMDQVKLQEYPYDVNDFHQQSKQYIASVLNSEKNYSAIPFPKMRAKNINDHILPNEWLYFKIYCHPLRSEELLNKIAGIIKTLFDLKELEQWFYINYSDPEYHIRLRLKLDKGLITPRVQKQVNLLYGLHLKGYIQRIDIETYQPEYERYGVKLMGYAEMLFYRDSDYCLLLIKSKPASETEYFHRALLSVHDIFESLQLSIPDRELLLKTLAMHMIEEIEITKYELDKSYRKHAKDIQTMLSVTSKEASNSIQKQKFSMTLFEYFEMIKAHEIPEKLSDILHMHINRLFTTTIKIHETTIYYWLYKYYTSLSKKRNA